MPDAINQTVGVDTKEAQLNVDKLITALNNLTACMRKTDQQAEQTSTSVGQGLNKGLSSAADLAGGAAARMSTLASSILALEASIPIVLAIAVAFKTLMFAFNFTKDAVAGAIEVVKLFIK